MIMLLAPSRKPRHPFRSQRAVFILLGLFIGFFPVIARTQQNLFNVPSSDITEKGQVFFQQQINLVSLRTTGFTTFTYGLGNNAEAGINLFSVPTGSNAQSPAFLFNLQKGFNPSSFHKISLGTQTGLTMPWYTPVQVPSFSYINNAIDLKKWGKYYLGGYYADRAYAGAGNSIGLMAGVEYEIISNKLHLIGDLLSGHNNISTAAVGAMVYLPGRWHLSAGALLPYPGSHNHHGVIFQITHE